MASLGCSLRSVACCCLRVGVNLSSGRTYERACFRACTELSVSPPGVEGEPHEQGAVVDLPEDDEHRNIAAAAPESVTRVRSQPQGAWPQHANLILQGFV